MSKSHRCFLSESIESIDFYSINVFNCISFSEPEKSYCGNSLVEEGEECDEGLLVRADHYQQGLCCDNRCRLIAGADCSDKNSECCGGCRIKERGVRCKERDDYNCKEESYCDGDSE
jgi:disintegrin and metalloproteinase domain-containing protein 17